MTQRKLTEGPLPARRARSAIMAYVQVTDSYLDTNSHLCEYHTYGPRNAWTPSSPGTL